MKNVRAKLESFRAECNVLNLKHQNIVQVLAASIGDPTQEAVIVMEFAGDCNLLHVINDPKQVLDLPRRLKWVKFRSDWDFTEIQFWSLNIWNQAILLKERNGQMMMKVLK